ncbi:hypothetical protein BRAS3809_5780002 [Bradyrhizobium sp. STM 3809]|nr:hypothetical protein BRAS3809_5780002 [Bradyrhizobium sp. STM 3809]
MLNQNGKRGVKRDPKYTILNLR